jgi:AAA+ superfamily predicted ATPase
VRASFFPPGTGKTTLARGLANEVAKHLPRTKTRYVEIDPHGLTSSSLGRSQQAVVKLFEHTIPELAIDGVTVVLLDELETLGVDRQKLSLEANPIDVHRATDAVLTGIDRLAQQHKNVLLIATTNFPKAVDAALLSRADHVEPIGLPGEEARREIILDTLRAVATVWKDVRALEADVDRLAEAAEGLDGRRIRKAIFAAAASNIETAKDPNKLSRAQIEGAFAHAIATLKDMEQ